MKSKAKFPIPSDKYAAKPFPLSTNPIGEPDEELKIIIDLMYRAALHDNGLWREALLLLRDAFNSNAAQFANAIYGNGLLLNLIQGENIDIRDVEYYENNTLKDPVLSVQAKYSGKALSSDIHYNERGINYIRQRQGVPRDFQRNIVLTRAQNPYWDLIAVLKSVDDPPFTQDECDRFNTLADDFFRISQILHLKHEIKNDYSSLQTFVNACDFPSAIVIGSGKIIAKNDYFINIFNFNDFAINDKLDFSQSITKAIRFGICEEIYKEYIVKLISLEKSEINNDLIHHDFVNSKVFIEICLSDKSKLINNNFKYSFGLSRREFEIIQLLNDGNNCQNISDKIGIKITTVYVILRTIRKKLGVNNIAQIVNLYKSNSSTKY